MSRINTNVQSLIAQRVLSQNNIGLSQSLERLSTGLRINRGKDDPAGLIASQNLEAGQKGLNAAITNAQRTDQVSNIAEGGLQEVSGLLTELQGLITSSSNTAALSEDEKKANQLQIDSILQSVDRIASATNFQGIKLLNGNFDFKTSGVAAGVTDFAVNAAKFSGSSQKVNLQVTGSAQQAGLFLSAGAANLAVGTNQFIFEVTGAKGSRQFTFTSSSTITDVKNAINGFTAVTGVQATTSGTGIKLVSSDYGSSQFVSVKVTNDGSFSGSNAGIYDLTANNFGTVNTTRRSTFAAAGQNVTDSGLDVQATINGVRASTDGRNIRINTDFLDVAVTLDAGHSQTLGALGSTAGAFTITGGGASFQLAGNVDIGGRVSLGIQDVAARKLGSSGTGFLDSLGTGKSNSILSSNGDGAQSIVTEAIKQVSTLRGRLGAFQKNTVDATIRALNVQSENTAAAQSIIRDADFAAETAQLTRSQILVQASTNVLQLANSQPQSALSLLRG